MSPDEICEKYSVHPAGITLKLLKEEDEELASSVLIEGSEEALKMLSELFLAVAGGKPGNSFSLSPTGAGSLHFSSQTEFGIYIHLCAGKSTNEPDRKRENGGQDGG